MATGQIHIGDFIRIAFDVNKEYVFTVESENSVVPVMLARFGHMGLKPARSIPPPLPEPEPSPAMKRARKKLKEAEDKLEAAKAARRQLDEATNDEKEE